MDELIEKLKAQLIDALNLEEITPEDIDPEAPLFGEDGLGLDSIDALEIILLLDKDYGIKLKNPAEGLTRINNLEPECIRERGRRGFGCREQSWGNCLQYAPGIFASCQAGTYRNSCRFPGRGGASV